MGSYKWGSKSHNMGYKLVTLLITLLITSHEPESKDPLSDRGPGRGGSATRT